MNTDIATIEKMNPVEIFQGEQLDPILKAIEKEVKSEVPDVKTVKGRDRIKSLAHKVAKTKTTLDGMGKSLVSDWKAKSKLVDASRKNARDFLDNLKEEIRKPVTEWEQAEIDRVRTIEDRIDIIRNSDDAGEPPYTAGTLREQLAALKMVEIDDSFEEFANDAAKAKDAAISSLEKSIVLRETYEAEQRELERLRKESADREQKERDERIAREAAEQAAKAERERAENEVREAEEKRLAAERETEQAEQRLKDQEESAERQRVEAAENAEREKKEAIEAEQHRIQQEKIREEQEKSRREADIKHRKTINNEVLKCFKKGGLSEKDSKLAVELIAKKLVAHISINY